MKLVPYDQTALKQIHQWKNPETTFLTRSLEMIGKPLNRPVKWFSRPRSSGRRFSLPFRGWWVSVMTQRFGPFVLSLFLISSEKMGMSIYITMAISKRCALRISIKR